MMRKLLFVGFIFMVFGAQAQQDPVFTQYMFNQVYHNPAFSGVEGVTKISLLHRNQWAGYSASFDDGGAPTTQVFSVTAPIYKFRSGFGAYVMNDQQGPLNNVNVQASYAYHLGIKRSKLSFGVQLGVVSQSIDFDQYRLVHEDDPLVANASGKESQVRPDLSMGVYFRSEKVYTGISVAHLLESEFDFGVNTIRNALENHATFLIGYRHKVNFDLTLEPSMMAQTDFNEFTVILGGIAEYKEKMWGGLSYRLEEDVSALLGYKFLKDKSLSVGYSFGYVLSNAEAKKPTTHEVLISYVLPTNPLPSKKIVRTPRFRH